MEVLPGRGWDNLRHKDMGQVLAITYHQCKTTEDRLYLLPDNVHASAIKESDLHLTSDLFDHWSNYTSVTAQSFQVNIGANLKYWGISGSFSAGYQNMKQHQVDDKSMTTRVQLRTNMYNVQASPRSPIDPDFKKQFLDALYELQNENQEKAGLLLELIIRDYGTHYITQAEAGAVLYREDFVATKFMMDNAEDKNQIMAAAGVSFLNLFSFGAKYQLSVTSKVADGYKTSQTSSNVRALGGAMLTPNLTVNEWVSDLGNNLVMTDRYGNPLSYLITADHFENVSLPWLGRLRQAVDDAIGRYYSYNTHIGCMNMDSPNFDYTSNKDDNSCQSPNNNYTFGGVFQTCTSSETAASDLCVKLGLEQKNYMTGGFSCPTNYTMIPLHTSTTSASRTVQECHQVCHGWWVFKQCHDECSDRIDRSTSTYISYWCVDTGRVGKNSGYMFGGLYTDIVSNPFTSSQSCPPTYTAMQVGLKLKLCVSDDYELGYRYSVPFAGLFSCQNGNPLVTNNKRPLSRSCPDGFSQHLATIDGNCEIHYCVKTNAFGKHGLTAVIRPPFTDITHLYMNTTAIKKTTPAKPYVDESLSGGSIAGIAIACVVVIVSVSAFLVHKRRRRAAANANPTVQAEDREPLLQNSQENPADPTYGSITSSTCEIAIGDVTNP